MNALCSLRLEYDRVNFGFASFVKGKVTPLVFFTKELPSEKQGIFFTDEYFCALVKDEIQRVQAQYHFEVSSLYLCVSGLDVLIKEGVASIVVNPKFPCMLGNKNIRRAAQQAKLLSIDWNKEVIFSSPKAFFIDGRKTTGIPYDMYGKKVEAHINFFLLDDTFTKNIEVFSDKIGLAVEKFSFSSLSEVAAFEEQFLKGTFCLVHVHAHYTELAFFEHFTIRCLSTISQGRSFLEEHLSQIFDMPYRLAWEVVKSYGSFSADEVQDNREILLKSDEKFKQINKGEFLALLRQRVGDFIVSLREKISEQSSIPPEFIIVCGDFCTIKNFKDFAQSILGSKVTLAQEMQKRLKAEVNDDLLGVYGSFFTEKSSFSRDVLKLPATSIWDKIHTLYEEYF